MKGPVLPGLTSPRAVDMDAQADRIYHAFPKLVGRTAALHAIREAIDGGFIAADDLMAAVRRYSDYALMISDLTDNACFIPHCSTWINGHRWELPENEWMGMIAGNQNLADKSWKLRWILNEDSRLPEAFYRNTTKELLKLARASGDRLGVMRRKLITDVWGNMRTDWSEYPDFPVEIPDFMFRLLDHFLLHVNEGDWQAWTSAYGFALIARTAQRWMFSRGDRFELSWDHRLSLVTIGTGEVWDDVMKEKVDDIQDGKREWLDEFYRERRRRLEKTAKETPT